MHVMAYPPSGPGLLPRWQAGRTVAVIAALVALVVLLCCIGGILALRGDDEPDAAGSPSAPSSTGESTTSTSRSSSSSTSSTSSSTTESSSSTDSETSTAATSTQSPSKSSDEQSPEPSGTSPATVPEVTFPNSFDGWSKSESETPSLALYRKGDQVLSVIVIPPDQVNAFYERLWEEPSTHGDVVCGKLSTSANYQCAGAVDDAGILVSASAETAAETAHILTTLLEAIAAA